MGFRGKNKPTLRHQLRQMLIAKQAYGQKKHDDKKIIGGTRDKIYSYQTMTNYLKVAESFAAWAKENAAKTIDDARALVPQYLQQRIDAGYSPYTIRLDAAALSKTFGVTSKEWKIEFPPEYRSEIRQHRNGMPMGFSVDKNVDLVNFCSACGVRRHELLQLRPCDIGQVDGVTVLRVAQGKGGKSRIVTCLNDVPYQMAQAAAAAGKERIFDKIPNRAPIHQWRREYAQQLYMSTARPVDELQPAQRYHCRGEMQGCWFDKDAMQVVSNNLGHNRLDVVTHYLL